MRISKVLVLAAIAVLTSSSFVAAQAENGYKFGKFTIRSANSPSIDFFGMDNVKPAPTVDAAYSITIGSEIESGVDGTGQGFGGVIAGRVDAIMDGNPDVIGTDLSDVFGNPAPNDVLACETLVAEGLDPATGMFRYTLSLVISTTGATGEFDTLVDDFQDPADIGFDADGDGTITPAEGAGDGITGKGPDGLFGTADDVMAMDGFADTGDGTLDSEFPLLPPFLVFAVDLNGDGMTDDDPPSAAAGIGLFLGGGVGGGVPVAFDNLGTVENVFISFNDLDGNPADLDGDGIPDDFSGLDLITIDVFNDDFNPPLGTGWDGGVGAVLVADQNLCSTNDLTSGEVHQMTFSMTYLSALDVEGFGGDCTFDSTCAFDAGDVNGDGMVSLLDIGDFVDLILTGGFLCQADFDGSGTVDLLDVQGMVDAILGG